MFYSLDFDNASLSNSFDQLPFVFLLSFAAFSRTLIGNVSVTLLNFKVSRVTLNFKIIMRRLSKSYRKN